jgi:uncharacterized protein
MISKKIAGYARRLLLFDETPERLALAFALGVFLSLTPLVGLHLVLGLAFAVLFGLNRVAVVSGLFLNNPWTIIPYYTMATYFGGWLMGFPKMPTLPAFGWAELAEPGFWRELMPHWRLIMPMALGSTILAVLCAAVSYPLVRFIIRRGRIHLSRIPM